jgi:hypothetical protein
MNVQQISIPISAIVKSIKKRDPFVLGIASLSSEGSGIESLWPEIVDELARALGVELSTKPYRVRAEDLPGDDVLSSRNQRFAGITEVSKWRRHRLTLLDFCIPSDQDLLSLGRQCDGLVILATQPDRETQKRVRHLHDHGIEVLGYWTHVVNLSPLAIG